MPVKYHATVTGIDEALAALDELTDKVGRKIMRGALRKAARPVEKQLKQRARRNRGTLARSVAQSVTVESGDDGEARVEIGVRKRAFYGAILETGSRYMPARPWMRPGLADAADEVLQVFGEAMKAEIDRVASKG